jgi:hypothetical protein
LSFNLTRAPGLYKIQTFQVANITHLSVFRLRGRLPKSVRHPLHVSEQLTFFGMGLSAPCPTPNYPGGLMFSVRVVSPS